MVGVRAARSSVIAPSGKPPFRPPPGKKPRRASRALVETERVERRGTPTRHVRRGCWVRPRRGSRVGACGRRWMGSSSPPRVQPRGRARRSRARGCARAVHRARGGGRCAGAAGAGKEGAPRVSPRLARVGPRRGVLRGGRRGARGGDPRLRRVPRRVGRPRRLRALGAGVPRGGAGAQRPLAPRPRHAPQR